MTRKKPRCWDKLRGGLSEVDKKMGTGQDVNDYKIKELEEQMDTDSLDGLNQPGINNSRNFAKRSKKSFKSLR
ncbi:MAG TPA: hypothetical protein VLA01_03925 [Nitrosopumilaceae archaeon]|nr:hypothetical protein [Nitrosopumilaceae archaeon]